MPAKSKKQPEQKPEQVVHPFASYDLGNAGAKIKTAELETEFRSIAGRLSKSRSFGDLTSPLVFGFEGETLAFGDEARDLIGPYTNIGVTADHLTLRAQCWRG